MISGHGASSADVVRLLLEDLENIAPPLTIKTLIELCSRHKIRGHLAILTRRFLQKVLTGEKPIESRLSKVRSAPFGCVARGDILFLKEVSGPLSGLARVTQAVFRGPLGAGEAQSIMAGYRIQLALDESFEQSKKDSKYATLLYLGDVVAIRKFAFAKNDRRAWVVLLDGPCDQLNVLQLSLTDRGDDSTGLP